MNNRINEVDRGACLVKDTYGYLGENHKIDYNKVLQETTESNAWQQGFDAAMKAHIEGHNIDPNRFLPDSPYDEGTMEDDEWVAGWVAAYDNCC